MNRSTIITGVLAIFFIIASILFVHAYTRFSIGQEKLSLLKGQERFLSARVADLNEKNRIIGQMNRFVDTTQQLGLYEDRWDRFFVNLTDTPLQFSDFYSTIDQTAHASSYYFKPESLSVRRLDEKEKEGLLNAASETDADSPQTQPAPDLMVTLSGQFLIKNH